MRSATPAPKQVLPSSLIGSDLLAMLASGALETRRTVRRHPEGLLAVADGYQVPRLVALREQRLCKRLAPSISEPTPPGSLSQLSSASSKGLV